MSAYERLKIDISKPRYDQGTYWGRAQHFSILTNPLNLLASSQQLEDSKQIVNSYRNGAELPGLTPDQLWRAKQLYDSAYHDNGTESKKMFFFGRMSAMVPCNMVITGCMLTFYKTTPAVVFWQWINQSFNAAVNYTQKAGGVSSEGDKGETQKLAVSYCAATSGAVLTAISLNKFMAPRFSPMIGRFVPLAAVAAANAINLPLMNVDGIKDGIPVLTADGEELGKSAKAARSGISQVLVSRIAMAMCAMFLPPIAMAKLEKRPFLTKYPKMNAPIQVLLVGASLIFATPLGCAFFPQMSSMKVSSLEPELRSKIMARPNPPDVVYYNKGL